MSSGWAVRFQKTCPTSGEHTWFFVCGLFVCFLKQKGVREVHDTERLERRTKRREGSDKRQS